MPQFNSGAAEQIGRFSEGLLLRLLQSLQEEPCSVSIALFYLMIFSKKSAAFLQIMLLSGEKEKWKPIFRPHPALNFWNRLRSSFWMDSIQNDERNLKAPKAKMAAFHLRVRGSHPIKSSQE